MGSITGDMKEYVLTMGEHVDSERGPALECMGVRYGFDSDTSDCSLATGKEVDVQYVTDKIARYLDPLRGAAATLCRAHVAKRVNLN